MKKKRLTEKVDQRGSNATSLTKTELEVMHYLTTEYLTPKQVAIRRQTSKQAVHQTIKKLKEKGVINRYFQKVDKKLPTTLTIQKIRLHAEEFNIKILYKDIRYRQLLEKSNIFMLDGNTIRLYRDSLEIYSGQQFYADTTQKADLKSKEYWHAFFSKLEHHTNIIILKEGYKNIKQVNQHYAEINNELAKDMHKKGDKLRLYDNDDGKLWLTIDNSHGLHELETLHPSKAKEDMDKIKPFFEDIRHNPVLISDILKVIKMQAEHNKETAAGLTAVVTLIKGQTPEPVKDDPANKKIPDYIN